MRSDQSSNRRKQILDVLAREKTAQVSDLTAMFSVSNETIRKDLIAMEKQRVIVRRHGVVELLSGGSEDAVDIREAQHMDAKMRIARAALNYIPNKDGDVVGLDAGSTTLCLARLLAERKNQTVVTHSMAIADVFVASDLSNRVYCAGGIMRTVDKSLYGPWTIRNLNSIRMTVSVLGTNGVLNWQGLGAVSYDDADAKMAYARGSETVIAILDSSKFVTSTLLESVTWEQIHLVITDEGIGQQDRARIQGKTQLVVV